MSFVLKQGRTLTIPDTRRLLLKTARDTAVCEEGHNETPMVVRIRSVRDVTRPYHFRFANKMEHKGGVAMFVPAGLQEGEQLTVDWVSTDKRGRINCARAVRPVTPVTTDNADEYVDTETGQIMNAPLPPTTVVDARLGI